MVSTSRPWRARSAGSGPRGQPDPNFGDPFHVFRELIQDIRSLAEDLRQAQLFLDGLAKLVEDRYERRRTGVEPRHKRWDGPPC